MTHTRSTVAVIVSKADVRAAVTSLSAASIDYAAQLLPNGDCWNITVKSEHAAFVMRFADATTPQHETAYRAALEGEIRKTLTAQLALLDGIAAIECLVFMHEQLAGDAELPIDADIKTICATLDRTEGTIPDQAVAAVMDAITRLLDA